MLALSFSQTGSANSLESLVMPGPVIEGHKKYEKICKNCHSVFSKDTQDKLCADCHKNIAKDIKLKKGYHGRQKLGKCKNCHTEHKGRNEDIVKFNITLFNHQLTDFKLTGQHANVDCKQCHEKGKKYHKTPSLCSSCHKEENPHKADRLMLKKKKLECHACHTAKGWSVIQFNHSKTKFKLLGKHKQVNCNNCHPDDKYQKTPRTCQSCHKFDDVHGRKKGQTCSKCHNARGWKELKFNHDKETKFPLKGKHKQLKCNDCHKKDPYKYEIEKHCISCHGSDDGHRGRFGDECNKCHGFDRWDKSSFDHDKDTKFRLKGRHSKLACEDCHTTNAYKDKNRKPCYTCHKKDDAHRSQQGKKCNDCHNEHDWRKNVRFDHDLTSFPLLGMHASLSCEECHIKSTYKDTDSKCNDCHKKDDVHKGKLGINCQLCHNVNNWQAWRFNHDRQTKFKLDGKHKDIHCHECHRNAVVEVKNELSACNDCHAADDVHNGQFGRDCARCHSTKTFKNARIRK
ncbi:MAG: cytochrome C [Gammaproteobacteria bacterium]|nr:cytochrome C [Gammaproteobacteria bacterium]